MDFELILSGVEGVKGYIPIVEEGVEWLTERRGTPGRLVFKVLVQEEDVLDFSEGSPVRLKVDGKDIFFGFVFKQQRSKDQLITVTAYDQLRYLKNKDTKVYENKTASQLIKMLATDYKLKVGVLEDTKFIIKTRIEENTSVIEMVENALDLTMMNRKEMFVLYDDFGKLTLKSITNMKVHDKEDYFAIDESSGENFDYTSSIDDSTYNQVKLTYDNKKTGKREVYLVKDSTNINKWGLLQYFDTLQDGENGKIKAETLLQLYNKKTRNLKITNAFGDTRVRAGSMIVVNLNLGDIKVQNFMIVEKCRHIFKENEHYMDLTLRGGEFIA